MRAMGTNYDEEERMQMGNRRKLDVKHERGKEERRGAIDVGGE